MTRPQPVEIIDHATSDPNAANRILDALADAGYRIVHPDDYPAWVRVYLNGPHRPPSSLRSVANPPFAVRGAGFTTGHTAAVVKERTSEEHP